MWLQNEQNVQANAKGELTWEEFQDLGNMDDAEEFYQRFGQKDMTKYEMQAEAMRQHLNPNRGLDLDETHKTHNPESNEGNTETVETPSNSTTDQPVRTEDQKE